MSRITWHRILLTMVLAISGAIVVSAEPPRAVPPPGASPEASAVPRAIRVKQLLGAQISIQNNTEIGTVDDLVLSDAGEVEYVVVLRSDKKLVSVPWSAVAWGNNQKTAVINITPDQYKTIPTYSTTTYPDYFTPAYRTETYKYYGLTPGQMRRLNRRLP